MQRTILRWVLTGCCGLGLLAAAAPAADAAGSVTTLPANFVTTTSATLHGTLDTAGQATSYEFQYGPTPSYQAATPFQSIPPGAHQTYVAATIFQLHPNTTYHFRVLAVFVGIGTNYQETDAGQDLTVTTKATGQLGLRSARLHVSGGLVSVPMRCASKLACKGKFSISAQAPAGKAGTARRVVCATKHFSIRPGKSTTVLANVTAACRSLLRRKPNHVLGGQLNAQTGTGQRGANRAIKLIG